MIASSTFIPLAVAEQAESKERDRQERVSFVSLSLSTLIATLSHDHCSTFSRAHLARVSIDQRHVRQVQILSQMADVVQSQHSAHPKASELGERFRKTSSDKGQKGEGLPRTTFHPFLPLESSSLIQRARARARDGAFEQWHGAMHSRCRSLLPSPFSGKNPTSRTTSGTRFSECAVSPGY